jgi:hypothetical protein
MRPENTYYVRGPHWKPTACCGLVELNNISLVQTPEEVIKGTVAGYHIFAGVESKKYPPFVMFTGVTKRARMDHTGSTREDDYGQALADYIVENKLGEVIATPERVNPMSYNNPIKVWVWTVDWTELQKQFPIDSEVMELQNCGGTGHNYYSWWLGKKKPKVEEVPGIAIVGLNYEQVRAEIEQRPGTASTPLMMTTTTTTSTSSESEVIVWDFF